MLAREGFSPYSLLLLVHTTLKLHTPIPKEDAVAVDIKQGAALYCRE